MAADAQSCIELSSAGPLLTPIRAQLAGHTEDKEASERRALRAIASSFWVLAGYLFHKRAPTAMKCLHPSRSDGCTAVMASQHSW